MHSVQDCRVALKVCELCIEFVAERVEMFSNAGNAHGFLTVSAALQLALAGWPAAEKTPMCMR
jgi:hypothetical protein